MALSKTMNFKGLDIPNAYLKIIGISGDKALVSYTISVFKNKELSEDKKNSIFNLAFSFVPSQDEYASRWDKQAYENAKTQEELIGAVDVLEIGQEAV